MLIVCWNVAGLSTTVNRIHSAYGNQQRNGKRKFSPKSNVVLSEYMKRHGADIFCIQEHKIPLSQLSSRSEPQGCANVEGFESFWSCCIDQKKKGLNGVVTYVRKGTVPVIRANSRPLGSAELDDQGRCVMTDHGSFVVFNVYVPASSGQPLSYKVKFLNALRRAMSIQRVQHNKKVILVGDLNISHRPVDKFWSDRNLFVDDIRQEVAACTDPTSLPAWKMQLATAWPKIEAALATKKVVSTQTTNSLTNQKYEKYRMTVQVNGKQVFLGSHESHPGYCEYCYDFDCWHYTCPETDERHLAEDSNVVSISVLAELLMKIAGIEWDESLQRKIAATEGSTSRASPPRRWLKAVLEEDNMVDAFQHFYPDAEGRYTCWHQFTNKRYTNEGARIDFTLVDASLAHWIRKGNIKALRCGCSSKSESLGIPKHEPNSEAAALCAATASGGFQPVSFEGGGIAEATQETLDTQFGIPHTGMIYTPPSFSDHTAISLLLDDECYRFDGEAPVLADDSITRKAQPHKTQKSIASFFAPSSSVSAKASNTTNTPSTLTTNGSKEKKGIHNFLVSKSNSTIEKGTNTNSKRPKIAKPKPVTSTANHGDRPKTKALAKGSILHHFVPKEK